MKVKFSKFKSYIKYYILVILIFFNYLHFIKLNIICLKSKIINSIKNQIITIY